MSDIRVRIEGKAGRITLTRPKALNAVTYEMCLAIGAALINWARDDRVALVIIDAEGEKAFSAGGDIAEIYERGMKGDYAYAQKFWRDEYRMNARIHDYHRTTGKPVVSFLQGFTMGGGMGVGCHGSHRVVGDSSQIAMPECGIGLIPDVGGSMILANAPGKLGVYAGVTGARMNAGDAIHIGFADIYIPEDHWPGLIKTLETTGDISILEAQNRIPAKGPLALGQADIDALFAAPDLSSLLAGLRGDTSEFAQKALKATLRSSPLAVAFTLKMLAHLSGTTDIREALAFEYRFTHRAQEHGDFLEGIRAVIIDKDRNPNWKYDADNVPEPALAAMLAPLDDGILTFEGEAS